MGYTFFLLLESVAICCWGLSGGMYAIRKGYDLFAIVITGWLTALGGGILRDVLLGQVPPVGISDVRLVSCALISSLLVAIVHPAVERYQRLLLVIDAVALGLFAVTGTHKALSLGTSGVSAVFLGMMTALAGGLVRDTLLNEVPTVVRDKHWYAFPTCIACVCTVFIFRAHEHGMIAEHESLGCYIAVIAVVVGMRIASVHFDLYLPGAMQRKALALAKPSVFLQRFRGRVKPGDTGRTVQPAQTVQAEQRVRSEQPGQLLQAAQPEERADGTA